MARTKRIVLPLTLLEKRQICREAKEAKLNTTDYVRAALKLPIARGKRNNYEKSPEPLPGDPDNAVDVEELARELHQATGHNGLARGHPLITMAEARREAKRRLMAATQE